MRKVLIFGNSGSGKSTLAKELCAAENLSHLDIDMLAWMPTTLPTRKPVGEAKKEIYEFIHSHEEWVIEGCYTDLLETVASQCNEMIYMNIPVAVCIANAKNRPWEPRKYKSKEDQDANLEMLVEWIAQYKERDDIFSERAHKELYEKYPGKKNYVHQQ